MWDGEINETWKAAKWGEKKKRKSTALFAIAVDKKTVLDSYTFKGNSHDSLLRCMMSDFLVLSLFATGSFRNIQDMN